MLAVSACSTTVGGSGTAATTTGGSNHVILTVVGNTGGPQPRSFNPYLPTSGINALWGAAGMIYEPLAQLDDVKPTISYPWLAQSWTWSNDNKTLTFHLRKGVTWTDGKPFTSADVVFTFNMLKKFPQLNTGGVTFNSISAPDASTAVMTFSAPSYTQFFYIAENTYIVPEHIWAHVKDPATYENPKPVGTGPYTNSIRSSRARCC